MRTQLTTAWLVLALLCTLAGAARPRPHILKKRNPTYAPLSDEALSDLAALSDLDKTLDWTDASSELARLLVPRVPGSANLTRVQVMVEGHFKRLGWARSCSACASRLSRLTRASAGSRGGRV